MLRSGIIALLLAACSSPHLFLTVPSREGTRSIVFGVHAPSGLDAYAFDATSDDAALELAVDTESGPISIEALLYERALADLGLAPGRLIPGDELAILPSDRATVAGQIERDSFSGWADAAPSDALASLRVASPPKICPRFLASSTALGSRGDIAFAITVAPDSILVATRDGGVSLVTPSGIALVESPPGLVASAALLEDDGDLWLPSLDGTLWRGRFDLENMRLDAQQVATISSDVRYLDGVEGELYLLDHSGAVLRFDGTNAPTIHQFRGGSESGGVVLLAPGDVLFGNGSEPRLVRVKDGVFSEDYPTGLAFGPTSLQRVPGFDVLMGTGQGAGVFRRSADGSWVELDGSPLQIAVTCFGARNGELIEAGSVGLIAALRDGMWCPEEQVGSGVARTVLPFRDGWLIAQSPMSRGEPPLVVTLQEELQ